MFCLCKCMSSPGEKTPRTHRSGTCQIFCQVLALHIPADLTLDLVYNVFLGRWDILLQCWPVGEGARSRAGDHYMLQGGVIYAELAL